MGTESKKSYSRLRSLSAGSILMLAVVLIVFGELIYVLPKLASNSISLSALLYENSIPESDETPVPEQYTQENGITGTEDSEPTANVPIIIPTPEPVQKSGNTELTLCFGGTVAIEDKIRKSDYYNDTKVYDFSQNLSLLSSRVDSDLNIVFLENIISDSQKVSKTVVPSVASEMLTSAGFDIVLCGYRSCFDKGKSGLTDTLDALSGAGLDTRGEYNADPSAKDLITTVNGIKIAVLQFTDKLDQTGANQLRKSAGAGSVSIADAENVKNQINLVRSAGAQIVIACVSWGKAGDTVPSGNQIKIAEMIAASGADLIIGAGSRTVQKAEYIKCSAENGSERNVLCVYSLGTLLSDNRDRINRMSGVLMKVKMTVSDQVPAAVRDVDYVPTYVWYYKQDGQNYYRTVAADGEAPDGMDPDQTKNRDKARELVDELFDGGFSVSE